MSEWDKLWEKMPLPITDQWGRTDTGPLIAFVMKVKAEGDNLKQSNIALDFMVRVAEKKQVETEQKLRAVKQIIDECKDTMIKDAILDILEDKA